MRGLIGIGIVASILIAGCITPGLSRRPIRHVSHRHNVHHHIEAHRQVALRRPVIGEKQIGKASVYSSSLQGRHMTNGERFNVSSNAAASKSLPIGTKAIVTNLNTGKSADVTIKDRGPVPRGRVVDLTPHTAQQIGLTRKEGVAPVAVVPTAIPTQTASNAGRP